jgi:adenylate kinase
VGKTVVGDELGRVLNIPVIHLGEVLLKPQLRKELIVGEDTKRGSLIIKPGPLKKWVRRELSHLGQSILESHFTDLVPPDLVSHCVILRTHPVTLQDRLELRKWSKEKIQENIQSEILGNCATDIIQAFKNHDVEFHEIDTSSNLVDENVQSIIGCIQEKHCVVPNINWLRTLSEQQLKIYFEY